MILFIIDRSLTLTMKNKFRFEMIECRRLMISASVSSKSRDYSWLKRAPHKWAIHSLSFYQMSLQMKKIMFEVTWRWKITKVTTKFSNRTGSLFVVLQMFSKFDMGLKDGETIRVNTTKACSSMSMLVLVMIHYSLLNIWGKIAKLTSPLHQTSTVAEPGKSNHLKHTKQKKVLANVVCAVLQSKKHISS